MELGYTIDQLHVGQSATIGKTITEADILLFAGVSGDVNPAHLNQEYAEQTMFKGRIAHGMLSAGLVSAVLGTKLPGFGTIYLSQTLKFKAPVKIGDTIQVELTCKQKTPKQQRDPNQKPHGVVVWDIKVKNQRNELVATYDILTLVERGA